MTKRKRQLTISVAQPHLGTGVKNSLYLRDTKDGIEIEVVAGTGYGHLVLLSRAQSSRVREWFRPRRRYLKLRKGK
jgi:hypothetical protein